MERAQRAEEEQTYCYFDNKYDANVWMLESPGTALQDESRGNAFKLRRRNRTFNGTTDIQKGTVFHWWLTL